MQRKRWPSHVRSLNAGNNSGADKIIPVGALLAVGVLALVTTLVATQWIGAALIVIALCMTVCVALTAHARGDLLVTTAAVLLFWMPFQVTFTRLNVAPQEIGVYLICLACALFERRGIRRWIGDLLGSTSPFMRLAILVFVLACLQSVLRIKHPDILNVINNLHMIVLYPVLFAFLIAYVIQTRKAKRAMLRAFVAGAAAFAVYALLLRAWGVDVANGAVEGRLGAESSFLAQYHPNSLGLYIVLALAFVPGIFSEAIRIYQRNPLQKLEVLIVGEVALLVGATLMVVALLLTFSRGALAALLVGGVVAIVVLSVAGRRLPQWIALGVVGVGMIVVGVLLMTNGLDHLGRYVSLLNPSSLSSDPNVTFRVNLYERAIQVIKAHPITGVGLGQFGAVEDVVFSPHNTYLDLWAATGLYGVLAFVIVLLLGIGAACVEVYRLSKARNVVEMIYSLGFVIALVAFSVQGLVETYESTLRIATIVWMLALCAGGTLRSFRKPDKAADSEAAEADTAKDTPGENASTPVPTDGAEEKQPVVAGSHRLNASDDQDDEEEDWKEDTSAVAIWRLQTTVIPTWQLHSGSGGLWQADTLQLPALGTDVSTLRTAKIPAVRPPKLQAPATRDDSPQPSADGATDKGKQANSGDNAGEELLKRAPTSFLWNQAYALWFFGTSFLLSIVITRGLSPADFGIYATLTTVISTVTFIIAMGLDDTATVFLPRVMTKDGLAASGTLIRRLFIARVLIVGLAGIALTAGLLLATPYLIHLGISPKLFDASVNKSAAFRAILIAVYLVGSSIATLQGAFFSGMLKSKAVLVIGGISQIVSIGGVFALLRSGWGIDGVFAAQAVVTWLTVFAYLGPLRTLLFARGKITSVRPGEMRKLMVSAWLTNITNGALGKQMDIMIMTAFAVGSAQIGYYNLAYQLGSIIGVVLISGLGGVGVAAMSAALSTGGKSRLASMWRANVMLQVLLTSPLQIMCFVFADQIVAVLYGPQYLGATVLLRAFLAFTMLGRLTGGGASQSALYVMGKQRSVVVMRWSGLIINVILDITLIQLYGPIGAMVATGFSQLWVGVMEYLLLRRHLGMTYPVAFGVRVTSVATFAALLLTWWTPKGLIGLSTDFILFALLFVAGLWMLKTNDSNDLTEVMLANGRIQSLVLAIRRRLPQRKRKPATASA